MPKSYRIRTQPGVDKNIRVEIAQDFDFLEILSLKLRQEDVYTRFCADYGVVVGRVITNGGYGVPNARVSVFVPLEEMDENDPIISTLYPYKNLGQKNEDGYRYNLLPYEQSYQGHTPTGTFPTEDDVLTRQEVLEIYEKYYKFTVKTNDSGDFMIIGVPLGIQKVVMDLDLSDMGCFSLRPSDLIRMGLASETQVSGQSFRSSTDLSTLPQIINGIKDVDVASFWGQEDLCNIGITRVDFDLRDYGIDLKPHSVFMGSIFSTDDDDAIKESCLIKPSTGRLCDLTTGPGQILAIRQTINVEEDTGYPILEEYKLENGGNIIDPDGTWLIELPMNLDYVVTNEFGEQVLSNDPSVGIPTKSKYRIKIKWQNEGGLTNEVQRANYLVPNIKEYTGTDVDTNASYAFSVDWNDYGDKIIGSNNLSTLGLQMVQEAIDCKDRFYEFNYNKVYTISSHIDRFKHGFGDRRHLGIKAIDDTSCKHTINKFPVNDGEQNPANLLSLDYGLMFLKISFLPILIVIHVIFLIISIFIAIINLVLWLVRLFGGDGPALEPIALPRMNLPMLSYPDCENCNCSQEYNVASGSEYTLGANQSVLANVNDRGYFSNFTPDGPSEETTKKLRWLLAGNESGNLQRVPFYDEGSGDWGFSEGPTLAQKINLANQRSRYFSSTNPNLIKTWVRNTHPVTNNVMFSDPMYDNVMILLCDPGTLQSFGPGSLITFSNLDNINDPNLTGATTNQFGLDSITGTSLSNTNDLVNVTQTFIAVNGNEQTANLKILSNKGNEQSYQFKSGVEYLQVITGGTVSNYSDILWSTRANSILHNYIIRYQQKIFWRKGSLSSLKEEEFYPLTKMPDYQQYEILFLVRGVDPYTQRQTIEYDLSKLFGKVYGEVKVQGNYYLNIPIQKNNGGSETSGYLSPQGHNIPNNSQNSGSKLFFPSYTFTPDSTNFKSFKSLELTRYSSLDKTRVGFKSSPGDQKNVGSYTFPGGVTSSSANLYIGQGRIEGVGLLGLDKRKRDGEARFFSPSYWDGNNGIRLNDSSRLVFRSDRLPTSDQMESHYQSYFPLHQNQKFAMYKISDVGTVAYTPNIPVAANSTTGSQDFTGETPSFVTTVIESLSCTGMVKLGAYEGYGSSFTVDQSENLNNLGEPHVKEGCYKLVKIPIVNLLDGTDINLWFEWMARYRVMYAACNGVFGQMFQNNWVNGTLYMPSFNKSTVYKLTSNDVSHYTYCGNPENVFRRGRGPIYFNTDSNNFYYKSTKYENGAFQGQEKTVLPIVGDYGGVNDRNLWFPTTIMDLGPRDEFTKQICFDPNFQGYLVDTLRSTSYSDTSDLTNMFIISRLANTNFWERAFGLGEASINAMFSRSGDRIDGDIAQLWSINSEYGVIPFLGSNYDDSKIYVSQDGVFKTPILGIFFDSDRETRQLITPGKTPYTTFGYPKTQEVPFYRWQLESTDTIFGYDENNWLTSRPILTRKYQDLDFDTSPYFHTSNGENLGYIYNRNGQGNVSASFPQNQQRYFMVGAPYHFYFGVSKGKSAMNRFITKYII